MRHLITCVVVLGLGGASLGDTWTVDDDGPADFDNIQAAVNVASNGDEIIVFPGTYTSTASEVVHMLGKTVLLHSSSGPETTIIDGESTRRGITFDSNETSETIIKGLTIRNGHDIVGGGMYTQYSSPTIVNCTFENNVANWYGGGGGYGGGMYNQYGSPTLENCHFVGNYAFYSGGGMANAYNGNSTLRGCTFTNNAVDGYGGGMFCANCSPVLKDCTFTSNTSPGEGEGLRCFNSTLTIENCTFSDNDTYMSGTYTLNPPSGTDPCAADINVDGTVNIHDLLAVISAWGDCP